VVEKSSEVIGELLKRIFLRFIRFVSLTITQHVRCDNAVASLNPRTNLMFPASPDRSCMVKKHYYLLGKGVPEVREPVN
jgi:hypothetical protein